jgi:hypothetical protein
MDVPGSELGRQVAVDFESDADFHECGSCPVHSGLLTFRVQQLRLHHAKSGLPAPTGGTGPGGQWQCPRPLPISPSSQGREQRRVSSPPQAKFGRGPLISLKDGECCARATEFQEAQKKVPGPAGSVFHFTTLCENSRINVGNRGLERRVGQVGKIQNG